MANKRVKYTFNGGTQDIAKDKHPFKYYFDAQHIRIMATDSQSTGDAANEKGTELVISLPAVTIVGVTNISVVANADSAVIRTTYGAIDIDVLENDVYLDNVTVTITLQPNNGTVEILPNKRIRYTDTSGVLGTTDTFTYKIDDGTTNDTAIVSTQVLAKVNPTEGDTGEVVSDISNYDGTYYYYMFAPCDRTREFFVAKSLQKITDNLIYLIYGSGGTGLTGKIAHTVYPQPTSYNIGPATGSDCAAQDELPQIEY